MDTKIQFWVGTDEWGSRFRNLKRTIKYLPQKEEKDGWNMMVRLMKIYKMSVKEQTR